MQSLTDRESTMRNDFGGPYDSLDARTATLFEAISTEKRRVVPDQDDVALARRAEHLAETYAELADIFERAEVLIISEDGHPLERTMAHAAAVVYKGHATNHVRLARQHRERASRSLAKGRAAHRAAVGSPFHRERTA